MTKLRLPLLIAVLCAVAAVPLLILPAGAQQSDHAKQIGGKFLCMCGCSQILTQCNHVGCTVSASMLKKLDQAIARGDSDDLIIQSFVQEYGPAVFAEPPKKGFSRVAWFIPGVTLGLGLALVLVVIRRWRMRPVAASADAPGGKAISPELLERARQRADRETED
ncbi:MAG: cytochrome c-type biogenesis protein CcmH [Acidobacteriia bacterium]|nr:cytochrome c-type biogenesis protein CcmH [Terriglobia bacterium]